MLYKEKISVNCNDHMEHCLGKTQNLLMLKLALHVVNNGLQRVKIRYWNTTFIESLLLAD
jgi:hypothetical protein